MFGIGAAIGRLLGIASLAGLLVTAGVHLATFLGWQPKFFTLSFWALLLGATALAGCAGVRLAYGNFTGSTPEIFANRSRPTIALSILVPLYVVVRWLWAMHVAHDPDGDRHDMRLDDLEAARLYTANLLVFYGFAALLFLRPRSGQ